MGIGGISEEEGEEADERKGKLEEHGSEERERRGRTC